MVKSEGLTRSADSDLWLDELGLDDVGSLQKVPFRAQNFPYFTNELGSKQLDMQILYLHVEKVYNKEETTVLFQILSKAVNVTKGWWQQLRKSPNVV